MTDTDEQTADAAARCSEHPTQPEDGCRICAGEAIEAGLGGKRWGPQSTVEHAAKLADWVRAEIREGA